MTTADAIAGGGPRPVRAPGWWTDMHTRYALPLCVGASLAAHLLLLSMQTPTERPGQAAHASLGSPGNLRLRLVDRAAKPETDTAVVDSPSRPAPAAAG